MLNKFLIVQINIFLDIILRPVFIQKHRLVYITKHNVSETGLSLRLQVKSTQLGPIDRASPYNFHACYMLRPCFLPLPHKSNNNL
jgi:hypothetical protein